MSDNTAAFLAEMILKLVPLGDRYINPDGRQASEHPRFTVDEIERLNAIRNEVPNA